MECCLFPESLLFPICAENTIGDKHTILTGQEIYVYSDNYPADYDPNLDCMASFVAEHEKAIAVTSVDFKLPFPCEDQLEVNDEELCNLVQNNLLKLGSTKIIDVSRLTIRFESNDEGARRGFIVRLHGR